MANDLNQVNLEGYIPSDARFVESKSGRPFIGFTIGAGESWKDKEGDWQNKTNWVDVIYRIDSEKLANALTKGKRVRVRAKLETYMRGEGDDREKVMQVVVEHLEFLRSDAPSESDGGGREKRSSSRSSRKPSRRREPEPDDSDDGDAVDW